MNALEYISYITFAKEIKVNIMNFSIAAGKKTLLYYYFSVGLDGILYVYNSAAPSWVWAFNKYSLSTLLHAVAYHFNFTSSSLGQNILTTLILQIVTRHHFHIYSEHLSVPLTKCLSSSQFRMTFISSTYRKMKEFSTNTD